MLLVPSKLPLSKLLITGSILMLTVLLLLFRSYILPGRGPQPDFLHGNYEIKHVESLSPQLVADICHHHAFTVFQQQQTKRPRKVYDFFLLWKELDWLEIRLHTLAAHVDYFVIVESPNTFTGNQKPLYLKENWDKFKQFHDKIIYHVLETDPTLAAGSAWDYETYNRNALFTAVFPTLANTDKAPLEHDVLLVSDIDEIPKPATISTLRLCTFPDRLTLRSQFYYYSFQWRHRGVQWQHPQATSFHGAETILPQNLRDGLAPWSTRVANWLGLSSVTGNMWDAAWHCSSCFATIAQMRNKMASFSHSEYNTPENRKGEVIAGRVREGQDLFGRWAQRYDRVEENRDVPDYIMEKGERFGYMLDRDGESAGFVDWPANVEWHPKEEREG